MVRRQTCLNKFYLIFFLFITTSCGDVNIKDEVWYADKGLLGAVELHTLTNDMKDIPKLDWDNMRFGMLCTSTDTFAEIKSELETLCSYGDDCTYDTQQKVQAIANKIGFMERKTRLVTKP